jgi:hypothetical protein
MAILNEPKRFAVAFGLRLASHLVCVFVSVLLLINGYRLSAQTVASREYQIKAAFLFNFAQFVEWPPEAFPDKDTPLVIGIIGDDPFGPFLDEFVRGEKVSNRGLKIERYRQIEDIKICHILFVSSSEIHRIDGILSGLKNRSVLTVGDFENFAQGHGGMIRFITEKNKIRFRINLDAAKASGLTISSKLLRSAEIAGSERK